MAASDRRSTTPATRTAASTSTINRHSTSLRQQIEVGQELTFDYAMRNFTIDHFPAHCLCGATECRVSVTGWKDLPAACKADYGELVAPYLRAMDDESLKPRG